jgi:hypothetical protein
MVGNPVTKQVQYVKDYQPHQLNIGKYIKFLANG